MSGAANTIVDEIELLVSLFPHVPDKNKPSAILLHQGVMSAMKES